MCSGEVDGVAEVSGSNDAITDASFVQSAASASEATSECGLLSVGGSSVFSTPLPQSVKPRCVCVFSTPLPQSVKPRCVCSASQLIIFCLSSAVRIVFFHCKSNRIE